MKLIIRLRISELCLKSKLAREGRHSRKMQYGEGFGDYTETSFTLGDLGFTVALT